MAKKETKTTWVHEMAERSTVCRQAVAVCIWWASAVTEDYESWEAWWLLAPSWLSTSNERTTLCCVSALHYQWPVHAGSYNRTQGRGGEGREGATDSIHWLPLCVMHRTHDEWRMNEPRYVADRQTTQTDKSVCLFVCFTSAFNNIESSPLMKLLLMTHKRFLWYFLIPLCQWLFVSYYS